MNPTLKSRAIAVLVLLEQRRGMTDVTLARLLGERVARTRELLDDMARDGTVLRGPSGGFTISWQGQGHVTDCYREPKSED